jgi:hypothetical protein
MPQICNLALCVVFCGTLTACTYAEVGASRRANKDADQAAVHALASTDPSQHCGRFAPPAFVTQHQTFMVPRKFYAENDVRPSTSPDSGLVDLQKFAQLVSATKSGVSLCTVIGNDPARYEEVAALKSAYHAQIGVNEPASVTVTGMGVYKDWALIDGPGLNVPNSINTYKSYQNYKDAKRTVPTRKSSFIVLGMGEDNVNKASQEMVAVFQRAYCAVLAGDFNSARAHIAALDTVHQLSQVDFEMAAAFILEATTLSAPGLSAASAYLAAPTDLRDTLWSWVPPGGVKDSGQLGAYTRVSWDQAVRAGTLPSAKRENNGFCVVFYPTRDFLRSGVAAQNSGGH